MSGGHGGKRLGAGRPSGTAWKPVVAAMRVAAVEHVQDIVGGATDPLVIALSIAADATQPVEIRLGACAMAIPVVYPRLTATTVQASHTVTRIEPAELMARLSDGIATLAAPNAIDGEAVEQPDEAAA